ncbi:MAG: J domain-containing protein [Oscillospiraceae bacterium]|jgi:curved DNA-binding protein CbpA|nr:J domain-containing protein [Oscillospiraceae bacterium]
MTDPYEVLNIPSTATDEEVKKAYRDLARKYHPDNYHDNPLADLAQEKMKEINAAYHTIQQERGNRGGGGTSYAQQGYGGYQYQQRTAGNPAFQQVRMAVNRNDLGMAEQLLDRMGERGGEWNFLKGTICYRRGWVDEARRYYQTACQMEPGNPEFRQALNFVENNQAGYQPEGYEVFSSGCGGDNMCGRLACTYLLCNLCGCGGMRFFWC